MLYEDNRTGNPSSVQPAEEATKPAIIVSVIRENMEAEVKFQKTSPNTRDPKLDEVLEALAAKGVVKGVNQERIRQQCVYPIWEEPFVAAKGQAPGTGQDGSLNYLVETHRELKPTLHEDGTADFKDLGFVQNVEAGQVLCEIIPPTQGEDGWDVLGNPVAGLFGRTASNPQGNNTQLSEDGTQLLASVSGHVEVRRGEVRVLEVMRIPGSVDNSTGNILFTGDVIIQGDISSGFTVQSGGSIVVKGTVEGADLQAKRDITINEGVNGMNRASLTAGGSIKCRYIQNCVIRCEENIYADTIMYCDMECGGNVELSGKRGAIIGGVSSISGRLVAKTLGTESHVATEIRMCAVSSAKNREVLRLQEHIKQLDADIGKLAQVMARFEDMAKKGKLGPEHRDTLLTVKDNYISFSTARKESEAQLKELRHEMLVASAENSFIRCQDRVHSGVRLSFGPLNMLVQESFVYSRIGVVDEEIYISPL